MEFHVELLDLFLVPSGLLIIFGYHLFLMYRYYNFPETTVIGQENIDKSEWVESIMQVDHSDFNDTVERAVNVISNNVTVAYNLATMTLTLSSLLGAWLGITSSSSLLQSQRVFGDTQEATMFIKDICLLAFLLIAFSFFIQAARHLVHANYIMSSPDYRKIAKRPNTNLKSTDNSILLKKVEFSIIKGGESWSFGFRALYFALTMLLWFFGPIPMFVASIALVINLYWHDIYTVSLQDKYFETCESDENDKKRIVGSFCL